MVTRRFADASSTIESWHADFVVAADTGVTHRALKVVARGDASASVSGVGADFAGSALAVTTEGSVKVATARRLLGDARASAVSGRQASSVSSARADVALGSFQIATLLRGLLAVAAVTVRHADLVRLGAIAGSAEAAPKLAAGGLDAATAVTADRTGRAVFVNSAGGSVSADRFAATVVVADRTTGAVGKGRAGVLADAATVVGAGFSVRAVARRVAGNLTKAATIVNAAPTRADLAVEALGVERASREVERALRLTASVNTASLDALYVGLTCVTEEALRRGRLAATIVAAALCVTAVNVRGAGGLVRVTLRRTAHAVTDVPEAAVDVGVAGVESVTDIRTAVLVTDEAIAAVGADTAEPAVGADVFAAATAAGLAAGAFQVVSAGLVFAIEGDTAEAFAGRTDGALHVGAADQEFAADVLTAAVRADLATFAIFVDSAAVDAVADFLAATVGADGSSSALRVGVAARGVDAGRNAATGLVAEFPAYAVRCIRARDAVRTGRRLRCAATLRADLTGGTIPLREASRDAGGAFVQLAAAVYTGVIVVAGTIRIADEESVAGVLALAAPDGAAVHLPRAICERVAASLWTQRNAEAVVTPLSVGALPGVATFVAGQSVCAIRASVDQARRDEQCRRGDTD